MAMKVESVFEPAQADHEAILELLVAYNETNGGPANYQPFVIMLRDKGTGATVGGLWARIYYEWLFVELLYIPAQARGRNIGSRLVAKAEAFARRKGCVGVWLNTYSFQAPGFYRKLGYRAFATLGDYPKGKKLFFFRKILDSGPPPAMKAARRRLPRSQSKRRARLP
ncbi:MAG TPA: GNAT family N-acetyltransferase [Xanthobacteraceae bacterium]|nr:GNAT family N-acetyltransferase [Xanthobacteraceae bacterium]